MKKLSFLALMVVFCLPLAALAQEREDPRVEIFGGYSLLHLGLGANAAGDTNSSVNLNGFNTSVSGNITRHIGVVGEFGRYSTSQAITIPDLATISGDVSLYTFLFGPRVVLHRGRLEPFVQGLFGAVRGNASGSVADVTTSEQAAYAFAYALGGGVDLRVQRNIAIRLGQLDYLGVPTGGQQLNSFRYSVGVVFRLGNH